MRTMGFLVSQHGQLGAIPPPPFLSVSPLESMRSGGAIPPLKRGISAILARYHMKTRQMAHYGCHTPFCDTISKGYCAIWGGISHWAAKITVQEMSGKTPGIPRHPSSRHPRPSDKDRENSRSPSGIANFKCLVALKRCDL